LPWTELRNCVLIRPIETPWACPIQCHELRDAPQKPVLAFPLDRQRRRLLEEARALGLYRGGSSYFCFLRRFGPSDPSHP